MKKPMERHRYIGFLLHSFDSKVTKSELWEELKKQCKHQYSCSYQEFGFRLIRFNGKAGILKCPHTQKNQSIKLLQSLRKVAEKNGLLVEYVSLKDVEPIVGELRNGLTSFLNSK